MVLEETKASVCLLIFTMNNEQDARELYDLCKDYITETVIVDSSDETHHMKLKEIFRDSTAKIFHAIPLGYPDPLREYALSLIKAEWVLYIDADERPSKNLLQKTRSLGPEDAYYVPRREIRGYLTWHIRLFRRRKVRYTGIIHEKANVDGISGILDKKELLFHLSGENIPKDRRYATIEIYTSLLSEVRPRILNVMLRKIIDGSWNRLRVRILIEAFTSVYLLIKKTMLTIVSIDEEKKDMKDYLDLMKEEFHNLDDRSRFTALVSSLEISSCGSLIEYLRLNDEVYLENLETSAHSSANGLQNLIELIEGKVLCGASE